jgi:hypothetical protein
LNRRWSWLDLVLLRSVALLLVVFAFSLSDWLVFPAETLACCAVFAPVTALAGTLWWSRAAALTSGLRPADAVATALLAVGSAAVLLVKAFNVPWMSPAAAVPWLGVLEVVQAALVGKRLTSPGRALSPDEAPWIPGTPIAAIRWSLQEALRQSFDANECNAVVRMLGETPENIAGHRETLDLYALEIVAYFERRQQLGQLWRVIEGLRPTLLTGGGGAGGSATAAQ